MCLLDGLFQLLPISFRPQDWVHPGNFSEGLGHPKDPWKESRKYTGQSKEMLKTCLFNLLRLIWLNVLYFSCSTRKNHHMKLFWWSLTSQKISNLKHIEKTPSSSLIKHPYLKEMCLLNGLFQLFPISFRPQDWVTLEIILKV